MEWLAAAAAAVVGWLGAAGATILKIVGVLLVAAFILAMVVYFFPQVVDPAVQLSQTARAGFLAGWVEPIPTILNDLSGGSWPYVAALIGFVPALYLAWWVYRVLRIFL